ncbi:D-alanine-D-alanine ligase [Alloprevotella rava F0323]|uniref:D-alanine--D-alanine ligase n=1 Tax=Alloprevotella rava F0323 TaxID=679199 RepID=G5GBT6_9BACT|nr:D-alanine--D-alanine ligase [Alloprevotella rava]EHG22990.1 D-alanine-D-alanine ligase [Alloprevotella rava F0323]
MKKVIAIVAGGYSSEHDVSLRSAEGILSFMDNEKYDSYVVDIEENSWTAHYGSELCPINRSDFSFTASDGQHKFDFAYITIHGTPGEDGILQGYFDLIGMPYSTSGVLVEAITFNKFALNNFLRSFPELHISDSIMVRKGDTMPVEMDVVSRLGLPCFVKPNAGGSSFGVTKVKTAEALIPAIEKAMNESDEVLIEKIMVGTEITCGAYKQGDEVVTFPITEVVTSQEFFDYDAKYNGKVSEITPARIADETAKRVSEMTKRIYKILGCYGIIRIDYILSDEAGNEQINMLEINTTPGMTVTSFIPQQIRAAGRKPGDVLSEIIEGKF